MLFSFALLFLAGMSAGWLFSKMKLPPLMGMLLTGILMGPCCLNLLEDSVLSISAQLRQMALIIILLRAGLNLKLEDLKKVGRPAILMCFVPATLEILGMVLLAPAVFGLSLLDSLILGTVVAAVSPAVIVPHMLKVMEEGYGTKKGIPQMILAGASADDVFVIVLFTCFTGMAGTGTFDPMNLLRIPTSIGLGILGGMLLGFLLARFLGWFSVNRTKALLIFLSMGFLLVTGENAFTGYIGFSGLIAVMAMGLAFAEKSPEKAAMVSTGFSRLWTGAEILLFVLVGAAVDVRYALQAGANAILLVTGVLLFRMTGVWLCLLKTKLTTRERLFCVLAYTPKATVQAAIGAIPLTMGLASGTTILTVAVVAILFTAPIGAFLIDLTYKKWLE